MPSMHLFPPMFYRYLRVVPRDWRWAGRAGQGSAAHSYPRRLAGVLREIRRSRRSQACECRAARTLGGGGRFPNARRYRIPPGQGRDWRNFSEVVLRDRSRVFSGSQPSRRIPSGKVRHHSLQRKRVFAASMLQRVSYRLRNLDTELHRKPSGWRAALAGRDFRSHASRPRGRDIGRRRPNRSSRRAGGGENLLGRFPEARVGQHMI